MFSEQETKSRIVKGIVSRDFELLEAILMNRLCVPDVPLEVYSSASAAKQLLLAVALAGDHCVGGQ